MSRSMNSMKYVALALIAMIMIGCEGGSSGSGGSSNSGHDFGENDPNLIGCTGDSITEGVYGTPYPSYLAGLTGRRVINSGAAGQRVADGVQNARDVLARRPGYLLILFGTNDMIHGGDVDYVISQLRVMIESAKRQQTIPVIGTLPPGYDLSHEGFDPRFNELSVAIRSLAKEQKIGVADIDKRFGSKRELTGADGLHPTDEGNLIVAELFQKHVN